MAGRNICCLVIFIAASFLGCVSRTDQSTGSKILFLATAAGDSVSNIYVMNPDGSDKQMLTSFGPADGEVAWPSWSPHGRRILYAKYEAETANAYIMSANGTGSISVPNQADFQDTPCWSHDGTEIAYTTAAANGGRNVIKVVKLDGSGYYVVEDKERGLGYQNWSPAEALFVLELSMGGPPDIFTMSALDGSSWTQLTDDPKLDEWPTFSRDGKQIAWAHGIEGDKDIWVMNVDGTNKRQVTNGVIIGDSFPSFSPDGSQIVFASGVEVTVPTIYVVKIDGSGLTKIADGTSPVWSPF
jgi:Tol biopolymer transport system component